jgi:hypothetical protein
MDMNAALNRIEAALDLVTEAHPGMKPHRDMIGIEVVKWKEDNEGLLGDPVKAGTFLTLAMGELSRDLHYLLEQAIGHMDEGSA